LKLLTLFNDEPINYKAIVKSNPDVDVFVTVNPNLSLHSNYNINWALELFKPFLKLGHNSPMFVYVRYNNIKNRIPTYQIIYTVFVHLTSSHFSEFEYSLVHMFLSSRDYNVNKYSIITKPCDNQESTTIFDEYCKGRYDVINDDKILGFYKAEPNPNYIAPKSCGNCKYHVNSIHLTCTVRPGLNELCDDYKPRVLQLK
jgi:hypothetical protein